MPVLARWIVSTLAVTTTIACTGSDPSGGELAGPTWTVTSLPAATIPAWLRIDATLREYGTVEGSDGCNRYGGPYSVTGDGGIDIGGLGGTDIGCGPAVTDAGAAFAKTLDGAASYEVDDDTLMLFGDDGAELVRLRANAGTPIGGVTWGAFGYRDGPVDDKQAVGPPLDGSPDHRRLRCRRHDDGVNRMQHVHRRVCGRRERPPHHIAREHGTSVPDAAHEAGTCVPRCARIVRTMGVLGPRLPVI